MTSELTVLQKKELEFNNVLSNRFEQQMELDSLQAERNKLILKNESL